MKKIQILLSCALIIGTTQLSAMKRDQSQITPAPEATQEIWLPSEVITKIAATCDPETRTNLSLINKYFNACASIKNNDAIMNQPEFEIESNNRLYYLFYGCIHNLKNLVKKTLDVFFENWDFSVISIAKHFIKQLTNSDLTNSDLTNSDLINSLPDSLEHKIYDKINPLCLAIYSEDEALLKLLLQHPSIDVNAINSFSLLKIALAEEQAEEDSFSQLPLHFLIHELRDEDSPICKNMIKLLLDHPNIDVNKKTKDLDAPLFSAIKEQNIPLEEVVKPLLTHPKIEVNAQNDNGDTPLHYAVKKNKLEALKLLLTHSDTDITIQNNNKETPLTLAIKTKTEIKKYNFLEREYQHEINRHAIVAQLLLAEGMISHTQHYTGK